MVTIDGVTDLVEIGRGGFGIVYRGTQTALGRSVAVKVLSISLDEAARNRFERERLAMGSLSGHPNIVTIYDWGFTGEDHPYLLMEYLTGGSLKDRIRSDGPIPWTEAFSIGVQLAGALETAHRAGVVHRDIKPANVFVSDLAIPKLGDFGIATTKGATATKTGSVTASIAHAAPEVLNGDRPTPRSDVYSLASTVYQLTTGRAPFESDNDDDSLAQMIVRIASRAPEQPTPGTMPHSAWEILSTNLSKDPEERHPSAVEFAQALAQTLRSAGSNPPRVPVRQDLASLATVSIDAAAIEGDAGHPLMQVRPVDYSDLPQATGAPTAGLQTPATFAASGPAPEPSASTITIGHPASHRAPDRAQQPRWGLWLAGAVAAAVVLLAGFMALQNPNQTVAQGDDGPTPTSDVDPPVTPPATGSTSTSGTTTTSPSTTTTTTAPPDTNPRLFVREGEAPGGAELIAHPTGAISFAVPKDWEERIDSYATLPNLAGIVEIYDDLGAKHAVLGAGTVADPGGTTETNYNEPYLLAHAANTFGPATEEVIDSLIASQAVFDAAVCETSSTEPYEADFIRGGRVVVLVGCPGEGDLSTVSHIAGRFSGDEDILIYLRMRTAAFADIAPTTDMLDTLTFDVDALN